jgi:hypothetical protein
MLASRQGRFVSGGDDDDDDDDDDDVCVCVCVCVRYEAYPHVSPRLAPLRDRPALLSY